MQKVKFNQVVEDGLKCGKLFLVVKIETEGNLGAEVIVNPAENFAAKVAYYDKAYNDNMELITAKNTGKSIRITDVLMTSNLNDLNWFIY
jgi:hypothetical protein